MWTGTPFLGGSTFDEVRILVIGSWQSFQSLVNFSRISFSWSGSAGSEAVGGNATTSVIGGTPDCSDGEGSAVVVVDDGIDSEGSSIGLVSSGDGDNDGESSRAVSSDSSVSVVNLATSGVGTGSLISRVSISGGDEGDRGTVENVILFRRG